MAKGGDFHTKVTSRKCGAMVSIAGYHPQIAHQGNVVSSLVPVAKSSFLSEQLLGDNCDGARD